MQTGQENVVLCQKGFEDTRIAPFCSLGPFLFRAFHDYIVLSMEIPEGKWLDRKPIVNLMGFLYLLKRDFGDEIWDQAPATTFPKLSDAEIDVLWSRVRSWRADCRVSGKHPWTYFREAWHEVSGEWLPGKRNPSPVRLSEPMPHAYYFKLGAAFCLQRLESHLR